MFPTTTSNNGVVLHFLPNGILLSSTGICRKSLLHMGNNKSNLLPGLVGGICVRSEQEGDIFVFLNVLLFVVH